MKVPAVNSISRFIPGLAKKKAPQALPVIAAPIVMAMANEGLYGRYTSSFDLIPSVSDNFADKKTKEVLKFMKDHGIQKPVNLKPNPNTDSGLSWKSKGDVKRILKNACDDGKISQDDYKKTVDKLTFTGRDEGININDLPENPSIEEINSIDISMPEELENFLDAPLPEIDSELMSNIMDAIPDGFEVDEGILSTFKSLLETVTDI